MKILTTTQQLKEVIVTLKKQGKTIGFVPTMGALHEGHLSLVAQGLSQNDVMVVSIFVNPTQFDNKNDLVKYPRTLEADAQLLETLSRNIIIFNPSASDLYEGDVVSTNYNYGGIENEMEGAFRTGHFDGVGTVVNLLLRAVEPDNAYFGQKDFQQLQIVKKLVDIEKLPVTIVGSPIVREENGLAMSSRNERLTKIQLDEATLISQTLKKVKQLFKTQSIATINAYVTQQFDGNEYLELEYFIIADTETLKTAKRKSQKKTYRAFIAAFAGEVRLIDNLQL